MKPNWVSLWPGFVPETSSDKTNGAKRVSQYCTSSTSSDTCVTASERRNHQHQKHETTSETHWSIEISVESRIESNSSEYTYVRAALLIDTMNAYMNVNMHMTKLVHTRTPVTTSRPHWFQTDQHIPWSWERRVFNWCQRKRGEGSISTMKTTNKLNVYIRSTIICKRP